ncbi:chemotaxis protein CheW [Haloplanus salilacus]|uniref:chemotaxis protein CheW n=1 Tax=Haloplanus salilacus TaxID=2949994 RepID=UPI0030CC7E52
MGDGAETEVLTFTLGDEDYCVAIDYVAEIVDGENIRSLPGSDPHVEGITSLRGQTTTVVDPTAVLDVDMDALRTDGGQAQHRIVVLDSEALGTESTIGWLGSGVQEVTHVADESLDTESIGDSDLLRGLIKDDDGFTVWLDPTNSPPRRGCEAGGVEPLDPVRGTIPPTRSPFHRQRIDDVASGVIPAG